MLTIEDITEDFLKKNNHANCVWLRDDWLSMRGMAADEPEKMAIYDKIADLKEKMRANGYVFVGDLV